MQDSIGEIKDLKIKKDEEKLPDIIVCDLDKCTGCKICEYACAIHLEGSINPRLSRIRVIRVEPIMNFAYSCRLCDDHPCINACPLDAIKEDKKDSILTVDDDKCDGCGQCIEVCRFSIMIMHSGNRKARVCDFCRKYDYKPKCVEFCPREALEYKSLDDIPKGDFQKIFQKACEDLEHPADVITKKIFEKEIKKNEVKNQQQ